MSRARQKCSTAKGACRAFAKRFSPTRGGHARCGSRHVDHNGLYRERGCVEEGGRTGLTALVVAAFFLLSLFLAPLAQTVPLYATAPALIFVACLMAANLGAIKWEDATEYIPALITALLMPSPIRLLPAVCGVEGIRQALSRSMPRLPSSPPPSCSS